MLIFFLNDASLLFNLAHFPTILNQADGIVRIAAGFRILKIEKSTVLNADFLNSYINNLPNDQQKDILLNLLEDVRFQKTSLCFEFYDSLHDEESLQAERRHFFRRGNVINESGVNIIINLSVCTTQTCLDHNYASFSEKFYANTSYNPNFWTNVLIENSLLFSIGLRNFQMDLNFLVQPVIESALVHNPLAIGLIEQLIRIKNLCFVPNFNLIV